jgi:hypothetical protein
MNADPTPSPTLPKIDLSAFPEVGLIIRQASGVLYTNQSGGLLCLHPEMEGVFYPLPVKPGRSEVYALTQHFKQVGPLGEDDAKALDAILRRNGHTYLQVNRARLSGSHEAWVHVNISKGIEAHLGEAFSGFGECEGVLIWPNSD